MVKGAKLAYIDTNILAYSVNTRALQHQQALEVLRPTEKEILCVSSQVLAEFYSYMTNSAILATPLSPQEAIIRTQKIPRMSNIRLLPIPPNIYEIWMELLAQRFVKNGQIFDLIHIAIMLGNNIRRIYTFNVDDFAWYSEIEVINPNTIIPCPEKIVAEDGLKVYQGKFTANNNKTYLVRAYVNDLVEPNKVVTVYFTSQLKKYGR